MINEQIRDREVRLIGADGEQLGIVSSREAQKIADEAGLDLVKIAPNAKPPVCKVIDYGKYRYEQARKEKDAKKKQKTVELKEIRLSPNIEANDLNTKDMFACIHMSHLTSPESECDLYLISFCKEFLCSIHLGIQVVSLNVR